MCWIVVTAVVLDYGGRGGAPQGLPSAEPTCICSVVVIGLVSKTEVAFASRTKYAIDIRILPAMCVLRHLFGAGKGGA